MEGVLDTYVFRKGRCRVSGKGYPTGEVGRSLEIQNVPPRKMPGFLKRAWRMQKSGLINPASQLELQRAPDSNLSLIFLEAQAVPAKPKTIDEYLAPLSSEKRQMMTSASPT
jgi:hypothetical protein